MPSSKKLMVVLGNQLFPWSELKAQFGDDLPGVRVYMAEDWELCTFQKHHQQKIVLFLAAMRSYADELREHGVTVQYTRLDSLEGPELRKKYETRLNEYIDGTKSLDLEELILWEIEDKWFERRIADFAASRGLKLTVLPSPMFLTPREEFDDYLATTSGGNKPFMAKFYERQRKRLDIMVDGDGKPDGGQWSFDGDNRKKLPKKVDVPETDWAKPTDHVEAVKTLVADRFADHPGELDSFWLPTTRRQALVWLRQFLEERFANFGPYEDAISDRDPVLFHSVMSPIVNLGLLTPEEIVDRAIEHAEELGIADSESGDASKLGGKIPINSLEGFVRQMIGWREFIRGVYRQYEREDETKNFWGHTRKLKPCWYDGTTGLRPLDDTIRRANRYGWTHHIERLMVMGNLFNLCEVQPKDAYDWFMCMFVDSSDWVMSPNVYGMGLMSDGGVFATKPYICGSNYLVKMSDCYTKSEDWCETMDGLYWRFVDNHRDFFGSNARMSMMLGTLNRMDAKKRETRFALAEAFIDRVTTG
ncbi:MAG: cryptochrome/photolyase family protein [Planctomycetota bacterium]